jgi:hypothetical protein
MDATPGDSGDAILRLPGMGDDPRQDRCRVGALREDCGVLDDLAAGRVRPRQARLRTDRQV